MKSKAWGLMLGAFFLVGIMAQTQACSVHITVVNYSNIERGVRITGPFMRMSDAHVLQPDGDSFTYKATGSIFNCHGKYTVNTVPAKTVSNAVLIPCAVDKDIDASGKKDSSWMVTLNKPEKASGKACGPITAIKLLN